MEFGRPEWLWLVMAVPVLALWIAWGRRRRARAWTALGKDGRPRGDGSWWWLGTVVLLILALAQPRWGRLPGPPLPPGHDVVLVIDTSRSMGAEDAVPDRLGVAVEAAQSLVEALGHEPGNRAAVVAFAGRGVVRCPLTENLGAVVEALHALRPGDVQPGGTNLGAGLDTALDTFDDQTLEGGRTVILFSDGEDHAETWLSASRRLAAAGILVHAVALGNPEQGHPVPSGRVVEPRDAADDHQRYVTYRGEVVRSRRDDRTLTAIAAVAHGAFVPVGLSAVDLGTLYRERIAPEARQRREALRPPERVERFGWFVLAALVMGLAGSWPHWWWLQRARRRPSTQPERATPEHPIAVTALALLLALTLGAARVGPSATQLVAEGNAFYAEGRLAEALGAFDQAIAQAPRRPVPRYNAAATLFQLGRFAEAITRYDQARERAGPGLRTKIDYALGNAYLALGDISNAIRHYDACLASTVPGPDYDAVRRDAEVNRRFAEELARHLPREPEPGPSEPGEDAPEGPVDSTDDDLTPAPAPPSDLMERVPGPPSGVRGPGGAGGFGTATPRTGSPQDRLEQALENARQARRRRLPDHPPPAATRDDRKDW